MKKSICRIFCLADVFETDNNYVNAEDWKRERSRNYELDKLINSSQLAWSVLSHRVIFTMSNARTDVQYVYTRFRGKYTVSKDAPWN